MPLQRTRLLPVARAGLSFNGVNQYATVPKLLFSYPMTICLWVKPFDGREMHYVFASKSGWDGWGPHDETHVSQFDGYFSFYSKTNGVTHVDKRSIAPVTADWYFISVVLDSTYRFYLNGSLVDSAAITGTPNFSTYDAVTNIGRPVIDIRFMYGLMSEVLIYSRALTDEEILWNFYYPDNPVRNGLVLWLHWDSIDTASNMWYDKSGFGNHATLYNGPVKEDVLLPPKRLLSPTRTLEPVR